MKTRILFMYAFALVGCIPNEPSNDDAGPCPTTCPWDGGEVCADLSKDPGNCGACGHRCDTPYCMFGKCAVEIAPDSVGATSIAVSNGTVYWSSTHDIMAMPIDGGAITQLAANQKQPGNVVADDAHVYWTNGTDSLMAVSLDGGAPSVLATNPYMRPVLDSTNVYWIQSTDGGTVLMTAPKLGGVPSIVTNADQPHAIAVDDVNVYVSSDDNNSITKIAKGDAGTTTLANTSGDYLGTGGDYVFWPTLREHKSGGPAVGFDFSNPGEVDYMRAFVTDGTSVFWIGSASYLADSDIVTTSAAGSAETILLPCGGGYFTLGGPGCPTDLALDSESLYWAASGIYRATKP